MSNTRDANVPIMESPFKMFSWKDFSRFCFKYYILFFTISFVLHYSKCNIIILHFIPIILNSGLTLLYMHNNRNGIINYCMDNHDILTWNGYSDHLRQGLFCITHCLANIVSIVHITQCTDLYG